jgi:DNA segregation ATPase FtsK/SpoIIIE, S-DNA-T family
MLASWLRRACGVAIMGLAGAVWLALLTWSIHDPSFSHATSDVPRNALGLPGAYLADTLLQMIGVASIFLLVPVVIYGLQLAVADHIENLRSRFILAVLSIPSLAAGLSALPATSRWQLPYGYGGAFGDIAFDLSSALLAHLVPRGSGAAAGLAFFIFGFWAFSRAIGLDRRQICSFIWFAGSVSRRSAAFCLPSPTAITSSMCKLFAPGQRRPQEPVAAAQRPNDLQLGRVEPQLGPGPASDPIAVDTLDYDTHPPEPHVFEDADEETRRIAAIFSPYAEDSQHPARTAGAIAEPVLPMPKAGLAVSGRPAPAPPNQPPFGAEPAADTYSGLGPPMVPRADVYHRPSVNLLTEAPAPRISNAQNAQLLEAQAKLLEDVLADFRIKGEVVGIRPGPVVTLFEFEPERGIKSSRIIALADDIARSMSATSARIAVIPGRSVLGIELPNAHRETVALRDLMASTVYKSTQARLPLALGKTISGDPVVADLARMPHLLIAGTTGSGKSVGVNSMILSLLYRHTPEDCRLIMIDPKMLELSVYNDIPHLLTPVVTEPQRALAALNWAVREMEERYKKMAELGVRSLEIYNNRVHHAAKRGETLTQTVHTGFDTGTGRPIYEERQLDLEPMPYIVVVVDEFADLMAVAGKEIEVAIQRLAQKARAAGIHLIMATQRPSVDVVTGTIKANFPTRISFKVASKIDSRTILNEHGAEQLLGQGDMLFADGGGHTQRLHGPYVSDDEVQAVARALASQQVPAYVPGIADLPEEGEFGGAGDEPDEDELYSKAVATVIDDQRASISYVQRRFSIGYNRAARILERMEAMGIVSEADSKGRRTVLQDQETVGGLP